MKKLHTLLAFLALVLAVAVVLPGTLAYFTASARAGGGRTVQLQNKTTIEEVFANWKKTVTITATEGTQPVYLRARAFSTYDLAYAGTNEKSDWYPGEDGWWYYGKALANLSLVDENDQPIDMPKWMTAEAEPLVVTINNGKAPEVAQEGEIPNDFDVTVVYETTPVVYETDGSHKAAHEADWSAKVTQYEDWKTKGGAAQ